MEKKQNCFHSLTLTVVAILAFQVNEIQAGLIAYDSFNYSAGNLGVATSTAPGGKDSGTGFIGAWYTSMGAATQVLVDTSGLSYKGGADLNAQGGYAKIIGTTHAGVYRDLATPLKTLNKTYYLSFLVRYDGAVDDAGKYAQLDLYTEDNSNTLGSFGKTHVSNGNGWSVVPRNTNNAGIVYDQADGETLAPAVTVTALLVFKLQFTDAQKATYTMWVNPDMTLSEAKQTVDGTATRNTAAAVASLSISAIRLQSNGPASFDEIRIGDTFEDVLPVAVP